jgi:hypothetical protein
MFQVSEDTHVLEADTTPHAPKAPVLVDTATGDDPGLPRRVLVPQLAFITPVAHVHYGEVQYWADIREGLNELQVLFRVLIAEIKPEHLTVTVMRPNKE